MAAWPGGPPPLRARPTLRCVYRLDELISSRDILCRRRGGRKTTVRELFASGVNDRAKAGAATRGGLIFDMRAKPHGNPPAIREMPIQDSSEVAGPKHCGQPLKADGRYLIIDAFARIQSTCRCADWMAVEEVLYSHPSLGPSLVQLLDKTRGIWGSPPMLALDLSPDPDAISPSLVLTVASERLIDADREDLRRLDTEWLVNHSTDGLSVTVYR